MDDCRDERSRQDDGIEDEKEDISEGEQERHAVGQQWPSSHHRPSADPCEEEKKDEDRRYIEPTGVGQSDERGQDQRVERELKVALHNESEPSLSERMTVPSDCSTGGGHADGFISTKAR